MINVRQLISCLEELDRPRAGGAKRRNRRRRRRAQQPPQAAAPKPQRARRQRRPRNTGRSVGTQGEVTISRSERIVDVGTEAQALVLHPSNLPWLKNLSKAFDMYCWHKANIEYRPVVGATVDGAVAVGFDWANQSATVDSAGMLRSTIAPSRDVAMACTPCFDTPVWQAKTMPLPVTKLQSKRWYDCGSTTAGEYAGAIIYGPKVAKDKVPGELWVHYTVTLAGTRSV
uniref:Capsid protein n=1 Tax=Wifsystermes virus TaxID=2796640 RepID=A0A7T7GUX2_9VIRU|nr:putative coat protein [Wifsystermes virus]